MFTVKTNKQKQWKIQLHSRKRKMIFLEILFFSYKIFLD